MITTNGSNDLLDQGVTLDGVTLNGTLDMSAFGSSATVIDGLTLDTNLYVSGSESSLQFDGDNPQAVSVGALVSSATIHLSGQHSSLSDFGDAELTFDSGITVSGNREMTTRST